MAVTPPADVACPFCRRIADGDVWATTDPRVFTLVPLDPVTPGHRLFIPKKHVASADVDPWLAGITVQAAATYAASQQPTRDDTHPPLQFNIITSSGPAATQTVFHLHVHLVPRTHDDGLHLPWTGQVKTRRD